LGSDAAITPIGGPDSMPSIETGPYDLPDLRPTGELNDQLPRWLQFGLEERIRMEGYQNSGFKPGINDSYLLQRFRFGMIVQPLSWVKIVAQTQDAESFFQTPPVVPPNENRWDLKLAYLELGNREGLFSVRVGRQELDFNNTLIANSEWRNQARSYDAVSAAIHPNGVRINLFAASVVNPLVAGISHHEEGNNIYGVYTGIDHVLPHSTIEPFAIWRLEPSVSIEEAAKTGKAKLNERAYGFRVRGKDIHNFDYRYELVGEDGSADNNTVGAWATTYGAGYQRKTWVWQPRLFGGYDYGSGDKSPNDLHHGTFDTMYPTAHDQFGITDQFSRQNIVAVRGGLTIKPHRRFSITGQYLDLWLAQARDGVYNSSGALLYRDPTGASGTHIGYEFDAYTWYEINREVHVGAGVGRLLPGDFLAHVVKGATGYTYPYFTVEFLDGKRIH
jgi:hypothetical protein